VYIVTIDTGTSNTRVKLWDGDKVAAASFIGVGVRDTAISGNKTKLQQGVREAINMVLAEKRLKASEVGLLLASGMITSNVGLYEVPHVCAPAGVKELAEHLVAEQIDGVAEKPIWFVPGVKNSIADVNLENCEEMDMMRGEEAETFGILEGLALDTSAVLILPGSHTKFVSINRDKQITGCITTLAGEMLAALTNNTILADALDNSFVENIDEELILAGARYSREVGLNRSCFTVRILDRFTDYSTDKKANFLLGAVLENDLYSLRNSRALRFDPGQSVIIGGSKVLKRAFEILVKNDGYFIGKIHVVEDEDMKNMAGLGSISIAKARGLLGRDS